MTDHLGALIKCYSTLVGALPRRKRDLEAHCRVVATHLRGIIHALGGDPDAPWVEAAVLPTAMFPTTMWVSREEERNGEVLLLTREDGIGNCEDGTPLGFYRLERTARIKVTTEILESEV
jgi:hypothetical protein